jgi:acyl transferase domain-containing protein/SAM-dependent methyltransferase/acyl carrier protein
MKHSNGAKPPPQGEPIAIIGMRGRFPGANDLDQYWHNLAHGVESIAVLSPDDMRAAGIPDHVMRLPGYVNASPVLDAIDEFDAEFFGFSARDAALTDPQQRMFIETAWEALEDAGYDPGAYPGAIGVFGGCELSGYLYQLYQNIDSLGYLDGMQLMVTNDKDHLCTQVAYRLNLRGPAIVCQTTCSTSLVAVSLACESLLSGRCDMALAGGVTVRVPQRGGYFYTAGSILSPDGHCRPFDADAQGTIVGSGVGLVVLKRLSQALADGDNVRAVILGFGLNNDGNDKVGYTAPSFRGQAAAIRAAQAMAGISPETIGYIEAHGTGTILGDPIELSALTEVFKAHTDRRGFCGIGSVKSNFGHLSCAAGAAGLIKTVLAMQHGAIPPTLHYTAPNPAIDFAASPFYVTTALQPWASNGTPRRAGVSSFGVGGTNAHVVVEEAPGQPAPTERRPHQLLVLSARTPAALDAATARLGEHLHAHSELDLADVAFTLQVGRRAFRHRRVLLASSDDREGVLAALSVPDALAATEAGEARPVVFMFPGQGAQYPGMAEALYHGEPVVRQAIDHCARRLQPALGADLRKLLFPAPRRRKAAVEALLDTKYAQPALFTVEYALAQLWRSWGVQPAAMIGHSVGEYVAAALAGVMDLDDALALIARRGQLISSLPRGSMLAVMAPAEKVARYVAGEVSLAAVNAPGYAVLSGPSPAIERVEAALVKESVTARRLHTSHAFHSSMMEPILREFEDLVARVPLSAPAIPFVATLNGQWADGPVTRPEYWSAQLRSTVRFADGLRALTAKDGPVGPDGILLEVGPGRTLATFAAVTARGTGRDALCLTSLPGTDEQRAETELILASLGQLWANGVPVDWKGFHQSERRVRVSLPSYPFERRSYWIGPNPAKAASEVKQARDTSKWFHRPIWRAAPPVKEAGNKLQAHRILVLDEETGLGAAVAGKLREAHARPIVVRKGAAFARRAEDEFVLNPAAPEDYQRLAAEVCTGDTRLAGVVDCWGAAPPGGTDLDEAAVTILLSPMRLAHALSGHTIVRPLPVLLAARGTTRVHEDDALDPVRALGLGPAKVLPQEHPGLHLAHVDVDDDAAVAGQLVAELAAGVSEPAVALRGGRRFVEAFEPLTITEVAAAPVGLPERPVVLITGGLGHMGMILAEAVFRSFEARLVLIGRSALPQPERWAALSEDPTTPTEQRQLLGRLAKMRAQRDDVLTLGADLNDAGQVRAAVDAAIAHFGRVDLLVHGAARIDAAAFGSAAETGMEVVEAQFSPKLRGLFHVIEAFRGREPRRWVLHSSISTVLGGLGLAAYSGANAMLDTLALAGGAHWLSLDWDAWDNAAEAKAPGMPLPIQPAEGQQAFLRALSVEAGARLIIIVNDLAARLRAWVRHDEAAAKTGAAVERHPRPNLSTAFVAPRTDTERALADIWGTQLGVDRVGIHDRFFDLGGHSLLAVQVASEIRDRFQIELPVLKLFQAPTVGELAVLVEQGQAQATAGSDASAASATNGSSSAGGAEARTRAAPLSPPPPTATIGAVPIAPKLEGSAPGLAAKASYREFYDDVTRRLERSGVGDVSFFLNYGYLSLGAGDEARAEVPAGTFNPSSVRLAFELIGRTDLAGRKVLDVGCGRGGTVALLAEVFEAEATGVDLSPEAIAFCRRMHRHARVRFEVGDAEHLPFDDAAFGAVTNIESSHTYPNLRAFLAEVRRVLASGGWFLYTDLLPVQRWAEVRALLDPLGLSLVADRHITPNVLASCDEVAATRAQAFKEASAAMDNFLAVPGSAVYEQMRSGAWEYRIVRARRR